ncbi:Ribosomal protein 63, mitochondrial [Trichoplax sp. H2]|uniref:Ribosomal protein 63, mitochondrial n=1 Tax=Trichoplax adhaerens TaxID=10228 RepID=B3RQV9_TRIAD|nr:hypothetical protein TRIADDRAFT_54016 [Trichoplax adhaerens]EDV26233.1 hypothetical protein TRIADDRAFT_54016 [Trichoplax adhaerens]RDD40446.1 Ribosomal protein 63, mitochondrial [Trichoplax sp. H2]|eukprot:XP_002110229.1 hypothetical protein TRIADDRAFT_54016 [Trichoplax adhaerens]
MFLTLALLSRRWTPGKQWIGKHRRIQKFSQNRKLNKGQRSAIMRRVDYLISRPYLTVEEELESSSISKNQFSYEKMMKKRKKFVTFKSGYAHLSFLNHGQKY